MKALITGWFSFEQMGNSAGDMIAKDLVAGWLSEAGIPYDIAMARSFPLPGSVDVNMVDSSLYTDLVFVCGPFGNGWPVTGLLEKFKHCRLHGVNISLLEPLEIWNPFTLLYERDSSRAAHPDITFYAPPPKVPVVGLILVHKQKEYGARALHDDANAAIDRLIKSREMAVVKIDTALENNEGGLRTQGEVESLMAKMDVVITTRLHGTVLSLKNGVPVVAVDPIKGGAKITAQAKTFGWPLVFQTETLTDEMLGEAFDFCLTPEVKGLLSDCKTRAVQIVDGIREQFIKEFSLLSTSAVSYV